MEITLDFLLNLAKMDSLKMRKDSVIVILKKDPLSDHLWAIPTNDWSNITIIPPFKISRQDLLNDGWVYI